MAATGETIFWKNQNGSNVTDSSDTWDDTELIKAYDKAVAELKKEEEEQPLPSNSDRSEESRRRRQKEKKKKSKDGNRIWKAGGQCLAIYSEDGLYYEAIILSVNDNQRTAVVRFSYYENEEEVDFENMLPIEKRSQMEVVNNSIDSVNYYQQVSSDDTHTTNNNKSDSQMNWRVNDICYVLNKNGVYQQAVLNSFKTSELCRITIVKSNKKREVKISQLRSSLPASEHKRSRKNSRCCCCSSEVTGFQSNVPGYIPPPLPTLLPHSRLSNPSFMNALPPQQYPLPTYKSATSCNIPKCPPLPTYKNSTSCNIPKCPPLPTMHEEVISGNEEALASMLMSWYISGFHTGFYQGMKKSSSSCNNFVGCNDEHQDERKKSSSRRWDKTLV